MKVLVVSTPIFQLNATGGLIGYGGLEQIAWECAKGLAQKGHEVFLAAPDGSSCPGVTVVPTGPAGRHSEPMAFEKYKDVLFRVDACISHDWAKMAYVPKMHGHTKIPVLGVLHAPVHTMFQHPPPVDKPCLVAISDDQARACMDHLSVPARRCWNGADHLFYSPMDIPRSDRYLFLARFSTIKNPLLAIKACKEAGVGLDLVGDTSITQEPEYFEQCKKLCDGKQIKMVGSATRSECVFWFSQAKALLHPTRNFKEPFGLSPVEAQMCLCPVVSFDKGALRETVVNGRTGIIVESEEQFYNVIKNNAVNHLDRDECRLWATSRFTLSHMVNHYDELLTEAVNGGW